MHVNYIIVLYRIIECLLFILSLNMYCTCIFMQKAFSNIVYRFCIHEFLPWIGLREAGGGKISEWRYPGDPSL